MGNTRGRVDWSPSGEQLAGGMVEFGGALAKDGGKALVKAAPAASRLVLNRVPGLPGVVLDVANFHKAKDKTRAGVEIAGGVAGGLIGGAVGGPLGAAAGSVVGEKAGELLYDHQDDIKAWMKGRWDDLARQAGERVLPYTPINRMQRAALRR